MLWVYIWLAVVCVCALIEVFTFQMTSIWFVVGGLAALILAACYVDLYIQWIVFFIVSLLLLLSLRRICMKFLMRGKDEKTNIDAFLGKEAKLLKAINFQEPGEVKFGDVVWTAIMENDKADCAAGATVRVVKVSGNKLIVEKVTEPSTVEVTEQSTVTAPSTESNTTKTKTTKNSKNTNKTKRTKTSGNTIKKANESKTSSNKTKTTKTKK